MRVIILLLGVLFGVEGPSRDLKPSKLIDFKVVEECPIPTFSETNLKLYLLELGIKHPEIVYAQAVLETGRFRSRIFRENHNLFGMKASKKRFSTAIGERYGHAVYNNWRESVDDYLLWQSQWKITPIEHEWQYYRLLDRVYAEDPSYVRVVKIVRKQNEDLI